MTEVASPGMPWGEGAIGYVLPFFEQEATTYRRVGVALRDVKFHPNVMVS